MHTNRHRRRVEVRHYLLRDSRTNARLKITIEMTHVGGTKEFAVPRIRRGLPVNNLSDLLQSSSVGGSNFNFRPNLANEECPLCTGGEHASKSTGAVDGGKSRRKTDFIPFTRLQLDHPDIVLRTVIPSKNLRPGSSSSDRSSWSKNNYAERDSASVIDMLFDQAKFHAKSSSAPPPPVPSKLSPDKPLHSKTDLPPKLSPKSETDNRSLDSPTKPKISLWLASKRRSGRFGNETVPPSPTDSINPLKRCRSNTSLRSPGFDPEARDQGLLTASPEPLSRITSKSSGRTETDASSKTRLAVSTESSASAGHHNVPSIDISSPGGSTRPTFGSLIVNGDSPEQSFSGDASATILADQQDLTLRRIHSDSELRPSSPTFLTVEGAVPVVAVPDASAQPQQVGLASRPSVSRRVSQPARERPTAAATAPASPKKAAHRLRGHTGITPEQALVKGYRGAGWLAPVTRFVPAIAVDGSALQALERKKLVRESSSESYNSLGSAQGRLMHDLPPSPGISTVL